MAILRCCYRRVTTTIRTHHDTHCLKVVASGSGGVDVWTREVPVVMITMGGGDQNKFMVHNLVVVVVEHTSSSSNTLNGDDEQPMVSASIIVFSCMCTICFPHLSPKLLPYKSQDNHIRIAYRIIIVNCHNLRSLLLQYSPINTAANLWIL